MSHKGKSRLQQLLSGAAEPEDSSPEANTSMVQDDNGRTSSGSSLTPSMSLQDLGTMPGAEALGWFNMPDSLNNDFDLGAALLTQSQEQFGFSNLTMDEFTDQVLKSSNGNNEQEGWCEVNLSDSMGTNQQLFNISSSQSDQLADSANMVAMQQEQGTALSQQFVDLMPSSSGSVSYPYVSSTSAPEIQFSTSTLSVDTTLAPSSLSQYHQREPQVPFVDPSYSASNPSLSSVSPAGTIAQHNRHEIQGSSGYESRGHQLISPASNHSSTHATPTAAVYPLPDAVDDGSSGYPQQYVENPRCQGRHSFTSPTEYPNAVDMTSHPPPRQGHEYVSPSQRLHHYPSPHQLSPCKQQPSPSPHHYVSPNQTLAVNLHTAWATNQHPSSKPYPQSNIIITDNVAGKIPEQSRWIEGQWDNTPVPQWPAVNQSAVSISGISVSSNQQRGMDSPLNYSKQSYPSNQQVANNQVSNSQHVPMSPGEMIPSHTQGGTTSVPSQRRQNTEQSLKDCGLYDAAVLSGKLVRRDKEIDSDLTDLKSLLAQFTRSLAVSDT